MKKIKLLILLSWGLLTTANTFASDEAVDVLSLVGRSSEEVSTILGEEGSCNASDQGSICQYQKTKVEIVFIDEKADWISAYFTNDVEFSPYALKHVGLRPAPPIYRNPFVMHWQGNQGLSLISVFGRGKFVDHIQVRAFTEK